LEFFMKRLRRGAPVAAALLAVAVFATSGADAKPKPKRHHLHGYVDPIARRPVEFPTYVDTGSDRNPGGDNLYFTDTRNPTYELGPTIFQKYEFK
jgi:hypothetical protein